MGLAIATRQVMAVGSDFDGAAPSATVHTNLGMDHYEGCTTGGLVALPQTGWVRLSTIMLQLDGTAHQAAASSVTVTIRVNGADHIVKTLSNDDYWIWPGGPLILPPNSRVIVASAPAANPTVTQTLYVVHEIHRTIHSGSLL